MDEIRKLLTDWEFPELIDTFQEHEIDEEALLYLNEQTLKEAIPKIGPRVKFLKKLKRYKAIKTSTALNNSLIFDTSDSENNVHQDSDTIVCECVSSPCSSTNTSASDEVDFAMQQFAIKETTNRKIAFYKEPDAKKASREVYRLDLETFLKKNTPGNFIFNTYRRKKRLTRSLRKQLGTILITGLMSDNNTLTPIDFNILSEKICQLFPTEVKSTYYIPRIPGTKISKPINPRGILIDKYRNLTRKYKRLKNETDGSCLICVGEHEDVSKELIQSANWLKSNQEPESLVSECWQKTFPLRKGTAFTTVTQFMLEWPILKTNYAGQLAGLNISFDFKQMFPNCTIANLSHDDQKWENFYNMLCNLHDIDKTTKEFIDTLETHITPDSRNAIQFAALPFFVPPKTRIRCKQVHWKPSTVECQRSLINLVFNYGNIQEIINKRKERLLKYQQTVQPYLVVIGASFSSIIDTYVIIDDHRFPMKSVLEGVDFIFKSFHVLNARYPVESEHIWLLIEKALYKVESHETINIPSVLTILKDLEQV